MADDIAQKVKEIIAEELGVNEEDIKEDASIMEDLGADSLGIVELVMAFEEKFDLEIPDEDTEKIQTVGEAIEYIKAKKG